MKKMSKRIIICMLITLTLSTIFFLNKKEDKVIANKDKNMMNYISMMIEQSDGSYKEKSNLNLEEIGYVFNQEKSGCENGGTIVWNNEKAKFEASLLTSDKCYVYFDRGGGLKIIDSEPKNLNANQAGMYRYQGSKTEVDNNYLCFGTFEKSECLANQEKYMYRILGITEDGLLKVIKSTAIGDYAWNSDSQVNAPWPDSDLYKRLNGLINDSIFLNSSNVDKSWKNYIVEYNWPYGYKQGNVKEKLSNFLDLEAGKRQERHYEKVSNELKETEGVICSSNSGQEFCYKEKYEVWKSIKAKIGLLSFTDVFWAVQKDGFNCGYSLSDEELTPCINSFLNSSKEESINVYGGYAISINGYGAWHIRITGAPAWSYLNNKLLSVRPVFYIKANIMLDGTGTINEPYLIKNINS